MHIEKLRAGIILLLVIPIWSFSVGQTGIYEAKDEHDLVLWAAYKGSAQLWENTTYVFSTQFWANEHMSTFQSLFLEQGLEHRINNNYRIGVRHRYQRFPQSGQHRFFLDQFFATRFTDQIRWKNRVRLHINTLDTRGPQYWIRLQSGISINAPHHTPFFQIELFSQPFENDQAWDRIRFYVGTSWSITDSISLKTYYVLQWFWKKTPDLIEHIASIDLILNIP